MPQREIDENDVIRALARIRPTRNSRESLPVSYNTGGTSTGGSGGGSSSGKYRQFVVISDGSGGFAMLDDGFGNPVMTLEDLE